MEKPTKLNGIGEYELRACFECGDGCGPDNENRGNCQKSLDACQRLGEYESTGLEPDEIPQLKARLDAAVADLKSCRLDHVRTCANYQKCFDKAKEEFRMMPCMTKSCTGWEWRGPQPPKEEK